MTAQELVHEIVALGVELRVDGDAIRYRPKDALPLHLITQLQVQKPEVLALLTADDGEVAWRVAVFRTLIPASGPIGFLTARPTDSRRDLPGHCGSCGEVREPDQQFVCRACQRAKWLALNNPEHVLPAARVVEPFSGNGVPNVPNGHQDQGV